ncbi:ATP-dependent Clp protease proteolytic subunit [bacterium HR17]|uniref:ATP-dependent Clp protease proteolytic subunit n=1 Tax=Candidatus Fervidibacter japonicus TaxID=2035412 RepID=A0A2H5XCF2_9BACT|nr:ATP-dependent Clp protease proteolytic subunit [bacterium HR17]
MRWFVAWVVAVVVSVAPAQSPRPHVCYAVVQDVIVNPALKDFLRRAIETAKQDNASCLVVQITTPGGMVDAMQEIVRLFLQSPVPVITFVAPIAGNADSAGAFIVMAGHIAAMAPGSRIGAAHPVFLPMGGGSEQGPSESERIMMEKVTQAIAATIKAIAELRGRNAKVAERMVRESLSLTAREAAEQGIVDLVADDLSDLLRKVDGRSVRTAAGVRTLHTKGADIHEIRMTPKETFLHFLSNPNITYLLLLIAMFGFIMEIYNPGAILPITLGVIAFLLFLYSSTLLPVSVVGVLLIAAAAAFFIAELFVTSHGVLAGAGIVALLLGGYMLFPESSEVPNFYARRLRVAPATLVGAGLIVGGLLVAMVVAIVRGQRRKPVVGQEWLIGQVGEARTDLNPTGTVFVAGSWWTAEAVDGNVKAGETVEVVAVEGLRLKVRRKSDALKE